MRALLQRVSEARVTVEGAEIGRCGAGLLILVCAMQGDSEATAQKLALKVSKLRIFKDAAGKMNRSVLESAGEALVVSQFTLAADTSRASSSMSSSPRRWPRLACLCKPGALGLICRSRW